MYIINVNNTNIRRIFISHSRKDSVFGDAVVKLLRGIGLDQKQIIYTSDPQYGIPPGQNIFSYLRDQINDDTYMIYLLSDNYYNSIVCLNEMGAAWVRQADALMLLLPGFDSSNPKFQNGVSDPRKMATKLDDDVQMWKSVGNIMQLFRLDQLNMNIQNVYKDYLREIEELKTRPVVQLAMRLTETERELQRKPQDPLLYHDKGYLLYDIDRKNCSESVRSLLYAMYLDPNYSEAYYRLIQVAGTNHDFSRSLTVAEETMRRFPQNAYSYGCRAYALKNMGRENEAVEDLCEAIRRAPDKWYYYLRGTSYQSQGETENALSDFWTIYHQYDPDYADTVKRIKEICGKLGLRTLFNRAENLAKKAKEALNNNIAGTKPSEFEESQKYFECVLLTDPNYKDALREFGGLYYGAKQYEKALQYWTRLLELAQTSYHYSLCAIANNCIGDVPEMRRLAALGLGCPDDGTHKRLQALLQPGQFTT